MKTLYVADLAQQAPNSSVILPCWVQHRRKHGCLLFFTLCDSTGFIQAVLSQSQVSEEHFAACKKIAPESAVIAHATLLPAKGGFELQLSRLELVGAVHQNISPAPRSQIEIFKPKNVDHLLRNRHLYLRNPQAMAILLFRDALLRHMRQWFTDNRFISVEAPILTPVPLYEDKTALSITVHDQDVFLTQCVGYYLEAAVMAFERVYNIGPSFRSEESRSRRHLTEYWHIKAEMAWGDLEDMIGMVEDIIRYLTEHCQKDCLPFCETLGTTLCLDGLCPPYPRLSYREAVERLQGLGFKGFPFGKSLGSDEELALSRQFSGPFWITGIPRCVEPFPYCIDPDDPEITRVADLIASNGYGELLGVAEKIHTVDSLDERLEEKNRLSDGRYQFIRDVHQVGCVPHCAFGMGVERLIRWLLQIPHVRDAIAFPRAFRRVIAP